MTVTTKMIIGLSAILVIGSISMLIIFYGLYVLENAIHKLANIKQPSSESAYEMEINVLGIAMGVLKYLDHPDSYALNQVRKDERDFDRFRSQFGKLAETEREKDLGRQMDAVYKEFKGLGATLIKKRDSQTAILANVASNLEKMDEVLDNQLQPNIARDAEYGALKVEVTMDLEADLAELGMNLGMYMQSRRKENRDPIVVQESEFRAGMANLKKLKLNNQEIGYAAALESTFNQTMSLIEEALILDTYIQEETARFISFRSQLDQILDEEIQVFTMKELHKPKLEADQEVESVVNRMHFLIPMFVLSASVVGFLLVRGIRKPVKKLVAGTNAVGRGDLGYRISLKGRDEFADLGNQFNQMVEQLEATTVSRRLLEASEARLRDTVSELRHQIADRERAEQERVRLEGALRRSEIMAAMGAVVAGVAHESRNPLFGISSIVDALETRLTSFGTVEKCGEHLRLLRVELIRLTKLMQDLLDYGKPANLELAAGPIHDLILEAINLCAPLANQFEVKVSAHVRAGNALIEMDRARLVQAFRNLIDNAVRYSPSGTGVVIEVEEFSQNRESWIECCIKDSGSGFAVQDLPRVFEPFFSRRRGGTGLGLSLVQRIVEGHGGSVFAGNRIEGGGVITVKLPVSQEGLRHIEAADAKKDFGC